MQRQPTIVVVDDSYDVRDTFVMIFERQGYRVLPCEDADAAFEVIQQEHPDVVITDVMLGITNGLDLLTRVRSDLAPPVPPVIVCSGFPAVEDEAYRRGAWSFVPKPFELRTILETVASAARGRAPSVDQRVRVRREADELRRVSIDAARAAMARLQPRMDDLHRRREWTAAWLPRYLGFGRLIHVLVS